MEFTHLHVHTEYSLLDGSNKIKECIAAGKGAGHGQLRPSPTTASCSASLIFTGRPGRQGINPILGCEVYVAPNSRFDREIGGGEDRYYHLVLLAENNTGLCQPDEDCVQGLRGGLTITRPRVDMELLKKYHEGIIALSACLAGEVPRYIAEEFVR